MTLADEAQFAMLLVGGIFTGTAVFVAYERVPIWRRMSVEDFAADFRQSIRRADPTQPMLFLSELLAAIVFASQVRDAARLLTLVAVAADIVILLGTLLFIEPGNQRFRRLPRDAVPPNTGAFRQRWTRFHVGRTVVFVITFGLLVAAVGSR